MIFIIRCCISPIRPSASMMNTATRPTKSLFRRKNLLPSNKAPLSGLGCGLRARASVRRSRLIKESELMAARALAVSLVGGGMMHHEGGEGEGGGGGFGGGEGESHGGAYAHRDTTGVRASLKFRCVRIRKKCGRNSMLSAWILRIKKYGRPWAIYFSISIKMAVAWAFIRFIRTSRRRSSRILFWSSPTAWSSPQILSAFLHFRAPTCSSRLQGQQ